MLLDRKRLGELVFEDRAKRLKLNKLTHSKIMLAMLRAIALNFLAGYHACVITIPLLFEVGNHMACSVHAQHSRRSYTNVFVT